MTVNKAATTTGGLAAMMLLVIFVLMPISVAITGFVIMLAVGVLHAEFGWPASTISFWGAAVVGLALNILTAVIRGARNAK